MKQKLFFILLILTACSSSDLPDNTGKVDSVLYLGAGENQPLIVGLGGAEGGNSWTRSRWKATREGFVENGYAFLALGYFGTEGIPSKLDRISLEAVHDAIIKTAGNPKIDASRVALIGGSKGAELALLLASHYEDIKCVIALVPGNCAFPALTFTSSTSSWTFQNKEVPYVPVPWAAVPSVTKHDLRKAFEIMRRYSCSQKSIDRSGKDKRSDTICLCNER